MPIVSVGKDLICTLSASSGKDACSSERMEDFSKRMDAFAGIVEFALNFKEDMRKELDKTRSHKVFGTRRVYFKKEK